MLGSIGFPELVMIMLVILLLFGPKKLPEIAKLLGSTIREFKKTINDAKSSIQEEMDKADISDDLTEILDIKESIKNTIKSEIEILDFKDDELEPQDIKEIKSDKKKK